MTHEQKDALNRVKATWAYSNNIGNASGAYRTEDMGYVVEIMDNLAQVMDNIKEDLNAAKSYLETKEENGNSIAVSLIESTLYMINSEELS